MDDSSWFLGCEEGHLIKKSKSIHQISELLGKRFCHLTWKFCPSPLEFVGLMHPANKMTRLGRFKFESSHSLCTYTLQRDQVFGVGGAQDQEPSFVFRLGELWSVGLAEGFLLVILIRLTMLRGGRLFEAVGPLAIAEGLLKKRVTNFCTNPTRSSNKF